MDDLNALLHDAVEDVEPTERLAEIRRRAEESKRPHRWFAIGGATLAVAAVVTAVAVVGQRPDARPAPQPAAPGPSPTAPAAPGDEAAAVYYVGDTPDGPRLFREFQRVGADLDPAALMALPPQDPDYRTEWLGDAVGAVAVVDGTVEVEVDIVPDRALDLQQLVYTVTGALGENLPVQLVADGQPVLDPLSRDPRVLAPVNISDPAEGREVEDRFGARGTVQGAGDVTWELVDSADATVLSGAADRTYADWATPDIDVSALAPGAYTLEVALARPDGGAAPSDTRTVVVR